MNAKTKLRLIRLFAIPGLLSDSMRSREERFCQVVSPLEYRWAALNLRKQQRLKPELLARVARPSSVLRFKVGDLSLDVVPKGQGLYLLYSDQATLYVGECENLQNRIRKHLEHSDNKELARWLWEFGDGSLHLELQVLDRSITQRVRRALELELIRSRLPVFNVRR